MKMVEMEMRRVERGGGGRAGSVGPEVVAVDVGIGGEGCM